MFTKVIIRYTSPKITHKDTIINELKPIAFRVDKNLIDEFRDIVKKSGYKQSYLISEAMKRIIKRLKEESDTKENR
jgi:metal-responsive CopG/Arc/MetJ family transcriptional regulator